ncbi:MAG: hypothetical protein HYV59_12500 [Planctomycetes bacterium]|nr:hypothetical protein [Planctomycetota bacterium]
MEGFWIPSHTAVDSDTLIRTPLVILDLFGREIPLMTAGLACDLRVFVNPTPLISIVVVKVAKIQCHFSVPHKV